MTTTTAQRAGTAAFAAPPVITYGHFRQFEGWDLFPNLILGLVTKFDLTRVCEIGAGANPALPLATIQALGLDYVGVEAESREIAKSPGYSIVHGDVCSGWQIPRAPYDLAVSRMTAEHLSNPHLAYSAIFNALKPGGLCVSSFSTLYSIPFVVNRLLPDSLTRPLLRFFAPRDEDQHDKFPAYYRQCRGPIPSQFRFFSGLGFEIVEYKAYFGHDYYPLRLSWLQRLHHWKTERLLARPNPWLTSYATVLLRRPRV